MLRGIAAFIRQLSLFDAPAAPAASPEAAGMPAPPAPSAPSFSPAPAAVPSQRASEASFAELCRGPYAHVRVESGKRLKESWKVTWTARRESLLLRVPASLESASREAKEAALRWAVLVSKRVRRADVETRSERRRLEDMIRDALRESQDLEGPGRSRRLAANGRRLARLRPQGACHDLEAVLAAVNARYFGGALEARITWASRLGGLSTHRLAEDAEGRAYHLITISRGYDCPEVTPEILGGVVYHECLHAVIPPRKEGGRRVVHGRDFRLRERQYEHYRAWREWHRTGLPKALRRMMRDGRG